MRKIQWLVHTTVDWYDHIHAAANPALKDRRVSPNDNIKIDSEDDDPCNYVVYYSTMELPKD